VVIDGKTFTAIVDENGKWSVDVAPALTDGVYEFTASITDEAGNESTATGTLTLDTQAPALTADDLLTNNSTPTLTGTSDLIGGTVTVVIDGKTFTAIVDENGKWSVDVAPALTDGVYEFTASITDEAGNESTATGTLTLDTQAPALTADDLLTNNSTPTLTGTSDLIGGTVTRGH
jgi:large repetitive protein